MPGSALDAAPDLVASWLMSVTAEALRQLDLTLLIDLLRVENDPTQWREFARNAVSEIELRTLRGESHEAQQLTAALHECSAAKGWLEP